FGEPPSTIGQRGGSFAEVEADERHDADEGGTGCESRADEHRPGSNRFGNRGCGGEAGCSHHFSSEGSERDGSERSVSGSAELTTGRSSTKLCSGGGDGANHSSVWPCQGSAATSSSGVVSMGLKARSATMTPRRARTEPITMTMLRLSTPPTQ